MTKNYGLLSFFCDSFCLSTKTLSNALYSLDDFRAQPLVPYDLEGYGGGVLFAKNIFYTAHL